MASILSRITGRKQSAIAQKTVVLNDFGLEEKIRTTSRGTSSRFTVKIVATPALVVLDAKALGQAPADAIAELIRGKIRGIMTTAAPATIESRSRAKEAFRRGEPWAQKRYGGMYMPPEAGVVGITMGKRSNRLPPMEPAQTVRLFNDSGRLAAGIVARPTRDNAWVVNVPANRFDPVTFRGGRDALLPVIARLQQLVPELGDPRAIAASDAVRKAIGDATDQVLFSMLGSRFMSQTKLRQALRRGQLGAARALLGGLREIVTTLGGS
jgi:hypothetical protein